jgi:NADPH-dependent glutamate synthase beta subunit-like oxidoreductase
MRKLRKRGDSRERMDIVLNKFRSRLNSYPPGLCPLVLYRSILQVSMNQSCGKCVPCRDGLREVDRLLGRIIRGDAGEGTITELESLCRMIAETSDCAVGVTAANTVLDSLREFPDEYESHIRSRRCAEGGVQTVPCISLCPAHVDVPGYVALIHKGDWAGAINLIRNRNPLPTACALVCEHPCESKCRRSIVDAPINIRGLKKYAVDQISADQVATPTPNVATHKRIAVVGGGPSGLTAAWFLSLMGHRVDLYEEHEKLGGMLRYGIPEYRLPRQRLEEDIRAILSAGDIRVHCGFRVGRDQSFQELREAHDAVYLALGAQKGNRLPSEGADAPNAVPAADFLQAVAAGNAPDLTGKRVALIGGGNVSMDAARTAVRLGAESVHVFTRKRDDYTASQNELEGAMQEGVRFRTLVSFLNIETNKDTGLVQAVWLQPQIVGKYDERGLVTTEHSSAYPYRFKCDLLIMAVGQSSDLEHFERSAVTVKGRRIDADECCQVRFMDGVFSGGDCVSGPSTAINAIAAGQVAAYNIDEYLGYHHKVNCDAAAPAAVPNNCVPTGRAELEERDPFERRRDFRCVECSFTPEEAERESGRCLRCDFYGCGTLEGGRGE